MNDTEVSYRNLRPCCEPGIDGQIVVKYGRANNIHTHKETPRVSYGTPSKDKSKLVIYAALNTTPITEDHRAVTAVMKNRKSEVYDAPTANNVRLKYAGDQR